MAKNIGFQVPGNNSLLKENVKFKDINNSFTEVSYSTLELIGTNGNYVAKGFSSWNEVALFINDTIQESFGAEWVGIPPYLPKSGGVMTGGIDMNAQRIQNLPAPGGNSDPARLIDLSSYLPLAGGTMEANAEIVFNGGRVRGLEAPEDDGDAFRQIDAETLQLAMEALIADKVSKSDNSTVNAVLTFASGKVPISVSNATTDQQLTNLATVKGYVDARLPLVIYRGVLKASGSDEPSVTVLTNTTGGTVTFARVSSGKYSIGSSNAAFSMDSGISYIMKTITNGSATTKRIYSIEHSTTSWMYIYCYDDSGTLQDGLENVSIELLIFPVPAP